MQKAISYVVSFENGTSVTVIALTASEAIKVATNDISFPEKNIRIRKVQQVMPDSLGMDMRKDGD